MNAVKRKAREDFLHDAEIQATVQEILHPYLSTRDPVVAIQFGVPKDHEEEWREAVGFASAYTTYKKFTTGRLTKHRIEFRSDQAWDIHQMYQMLEKSPHLEIFIDNMKLPYAATLWLPLLWFYL